MIIKELAVQCAVVEIVVENLRVNLVLRAKLLNSGIKYNMV